MKKPSSLALLTIVLACFIQLLPLITVAQRGKLESKDGPLNLDADKIKLTLEVVDIDSTSQKLSPKINITDVATNQQPQNARIETDSLKNSVLFLPFEKKYNIKISAEAYIDTVFLVDVMQIVEYDLFQQIKLRPKKRRFKINLQDVEDEGGTVFLVNKKTNERVEVKLNQKKGTYEVDLREGDEYELEITNANKTATSIRALNAKSKKGGVLAANPEDVELVLGQRMYLIYAEFAYNSAELNEKIQYQLKRVAHNITKDKKIRIEIAAHTDNTGTYERNVALSRQRAEAVFNFLVNECGVATEQLSPKGYGPTKPLLPNDTEWNRSRNRRFELIVLDK